MAWLAATPKGMKQPRGEVYIGIKAEPDARCVWLIEAALSCGLYSSGHMSVGPISWSEIIAWAEATGWRGYWITQMIRDLSLVYIKQLREAENPACPSPIEVERTEQQRAVALQFKRFVAAKS